MTGGRASRDKGNRREREFVNHWLAKGIKAERVPLSGASGGSYTGDVDWYPLGKDEPVLVGEIKGRKEGAGWKTLQRWLGENQFLILHADRSERLYVIPESVIERLVKP